ncbi:MAG: hypothetical protein ABSF14_14065 [Terriglobia bacterium]|jgi:WD40 repeat protein/uncharacterized caspase-like protein
MRSEEHPLRIKHLAMLVILACWPSWGLAQNQAGESARPEIYVQAGHAVAGPVALSVSPDGRWLASGGLDRAVKLWEVGTGRQLRTLAGHRDLIYSIAVSPDGKLLATASADHTVRIWDVRTGKATQSLEFKLDPSSIFSSLEAGSLAGRMFGKVTAVVFNPDGRSVAAATNEGTIVLWDVASGQEICRLPEHLQKTKKRGGVSISLPRHGIDALGLSPDGRFLAAAEAAEEKVGGTVRVWDVASRQEIQTFKGLAENVNAVAFSPDSLRLAAAMNGVPKQPGEATVRIWSVDGWREAGKILVQTGSGVTVESLAFSPDGRTLATGSGDGLVRLWEVASGREVRSFKGHAEPVSSVVFSPDGTWLASASHDNVIRVWDVAAGVARQTMTGGAVSEIGLADFSGDGRSLISVNGHAESLAWNLWDLSAGGLQHIVPRDVKFSALSVSPDGHLLAAGALGLDGTLKVLEISTGREIFTVEKAHAKGISSAAFSPDARWVATGGGDGSIKLWEVPTGREVRTLQGHTESAWSLSFSSDGSRLVSGSEDKSVRVWDVATGRELGTVYPVENGEWVIRAALSPDGRLLAAVGLSGFIHIREVGSWQEVKQLRGQQGLDFFANPLVFSPDNTRFIFTRANDIVVLPLTGRGEELTLRGHTSGVPSLNFGHDGRYLVSGSDDGTVRLWDFNTGELLAVLVSERDSMNWVAVTPDGLFDGSPEAFKNILWRFNGNTFDVSPVEVFFNEYYYPGLLGEILAGKRPKPARDIAQKDRRQPQVKLALAEGQVENVASRTVAVKLEVSEAPADQARPQGSGARDVRLFRNGSLVKVWRGDVLVGKGSKVTLEAILPIVAGENRLSAYAFSAENIKSSDATLVVTGAENLKRAGTAYILAVGVNEYANKDYNLNYAKADAQAFGEELARQQTKLKNFGSVQVVALLNQAATKANILRALARLAGTDTGPLPAGAPGDLQKLKPAEPEDAVFVYFAGHGTAAGPRFYLIPHDLGYSGSRTALDQAGLQTILAHGISDVELEQAFEKVDAGRLMLVIDACNSGQALEAEEKRRGPMNSKGLAQLAYEKGMYILTAAQGYQAALEAAQLGHGFLTYALVEEGLKTAAADTAPKDGQVVTREWLDYATMRVPQMQEAQMQEAQKAGRDLVFVEGEQSVREVDKRSLQRPRVFYRREPETVPLVVARVPGSSQTPEQGRILGTSDQTGQIVSARPEVVGTAPAPPTASAPAVTPTPASTPPALTSPSVPSATVSFLDIAFTQPNGWEVTKNQPGERLEYKDLQSGASIALSYFQQRSAGALVKNPPTMLKTLNTDFVKDLKKKGVQIVELGFTDQRPVGDLQVYSWDLIYQAGGAVWWRTDMVVDAKASRVYLFKTTGEPDRKGAVNDTLAQVISSLKRTGR